MSSDLQPGLLVLHGNRLEWLRETVFEFVAGHPLGPLEEDIFLVQSNGVAEWLKMALAEQQGICAATRVELPARFLWRTYRQVLGREAVPARSPTDRAALTWRLMVHLEARLLAQGGPTVCDPRYAPLTDYLGVDPSDASRRLQLCERLADLFDQYQVHRADWLQDWALGHDRLLTPGLADLALTEDQLWQPLLWRELLAQLAPGQREFSRDRIHARAMQALQAGSWVRPAALPRRVVVFGMAHLPMQSLEALAALAQHMQVLMAVPNPCRFHWADALEGRELLAAQRRQPRHAHRAGDLSQRPMEDMHLHAHPLLAAWGRQGRDFLRQLDAFDDAQAARERFALPRIDLFDDALPTHASLLAQVQAHVRDMTPLSEHPPVEVPASDRSVVFHVAHSAQREVEVLHDQLLDWLAQPGQGEALKPREVVVMVPDVNTMAAAIEAVFGQYPRNDPRHIPYQIVDQAQKGRHPLWVALEWVLHLPQQRCTQGEIRDVLGVPAVWRKLGLQASDLAVLAPWLEDSGARWGLDHAHRDGLGLGECGELNSLLFALRRMMQGYATGTAPAWGDIEPFAEVAGLEAALAGPLVHLVERLRQWRAEWVQPATAAVWCERFRALLEQLFDTADEADLLRVAQARDALGLWQQACADAGFDDTVPLAVARSAWLSGIEAQGRDQRFVAGGVTFCTLLPMRAIPFKVVCLLGMNEGDYPRASPRSDFDLMALPGVRRPGDRARRDDDRYLMLEALLSARQCFYVSWTGRHPRDNTSLPPSVLVSQWRDYLAAGWGRQVLAQRTLEHPLQPFSRKYFQPPAPGLERGQQWFTHAREWRSAHDAMPTADPPVTAPQAVNEEPETLDVRTLAGLLRNPPQAFCQHRLLTRLLDPLAQDDTGQDDEPFEVKGLVRHRHVDALIEHLIAQPPGPSPAEPSPLTAALEHALLRLVRQGVLPLGEPGLLARQELARTALPVALAWRAWEAEHAPPCEAQRHQLRTEHGGLTLTDWLDARPRLQPAPDDLTWQGQWTASKLLLPPTARERRDPAFRPTAAHLRPEKLLTAWVWSLLASACGHAVGQVLVGCDARVTLTPPEPDLARLALADLLQGWQEGMRQPLPLMPRTALAWLVDGEDAARLVYDADPHRPIPGESDNLHAGRFFPDFDALAQGPLLPRWAPRLYQPLQNWVQAHATVHPHAPHDPYATA